MNKLMVAMAFLLAGGAGAQVPEDYKPLGKIKSRSTKEIKSSNWILGCETLDRDMADYDQYKEYLVPLGVA